MANACFGALVKTATVKSAIAVFTSNGAAPFVKLDPDTLKRSFTADTQFVYRKRLCQVSNYKHVFSMKAATLCFQPYVTSSTRQHVI